MAEHRARFRLGVFVAGSFVALAGLAILFGGSPQLFSTRAKYTLLFPEAPGILPGTPVRKSGVRIGEVAALELDEQSGLVRVVVQVDKKFLPRKAEEPVISRGILSGDATIDFVPKKDEGVANSEIYPPFSDITGVPPINARALINQATATLPNAQEQIAQIVATFRRFEALAPKLETTLDEFVLLAKSGREVVPELRRTNTKFQDLLGANDQPDEDANLRALIREIRDFVKAVRPVAEDLRTILTDNKDELKRTIAALRTIGERVTELLNEENRRAFGETLKNVEGVTEDLGKVVRLAVPLFEEAEKTVKLLNQRLTQAEKIFANVERASVPIADGAGDIVKNINLASLQLAQTLGELRAVLGQAGNRDGSVGKLLSDPSLFQNINEAASSLTRTLIRAERVAKDLEVFADKVARRPELIGIGGALKPSTGLKNSPNAASTGPVFPSIPVGGPNLAPAPPAVNPVAPIPSLPPGGPMPPPTGVQYRPRVTLPEPIYPQRPE
jgi:phospholipid/cholesterol/gamma-HCH transport system substrate-binding protein